MNMKMKTIYRVLVIAVLACNVIGFGNPLSQTERSKLDPALRRLLVSPTLVSHQMGILRVDGMMFSEYNLCLLVKHNGTPDELRRAGFAVQSRIGNIYSGYIKPDRLQELTQLDDLVYVEAAKKIKPSNDVSVPETGALTAQSQHSLNGGAGAIIGIIDSGIDWRHGDFRNVDGSTRIKYLLDFSEPGDTNGDGKLDGPDSYGGTLFTEAEINQALGGTGTVSEADRNGHGSHVAGIAAGNGRGTGNGIPAGTYAGVARSADLVVIKASRTDLGSFSSFDEVNAIHFVDSVASELGQPYVINISLGSHSGAHDGSSLEEQAIDALVGSGKPGKAIVAAAGNSNGSNLHSSGALSSSTSSITTNLFITSYTAQAGAQNDYALLDIWYDGSASQSIAITTPQGATYGPVASGSYLAEETSEGTIIIDNAWGGLDPNNGDGHIELLIIDYAESQRPAPGTWKIKMAGTSGMFDMWLASASFGAEFTSNVDNSRIVQIPGTANNVITVGAYVTKTQWVDLDGVTRNQTFLGWSNKSYGDLAEYSSPGPTRDNRLKPEITAPGHQIGSAFSSQAPVTGEYSIFNVSQLGYPINTLVFQDNKHAILQGTSMAAPFVTGAVALMFAKNSTLDAQQIKDALTNGAKKDAYTGSTKNNAWGYGKLDVLAACDQITDTRNFSAPQALQATGNEISIRLTWQNPPSSAALANTYEAELAVADFDPGERQHSDFVKDESVKQQSHQINLQQTGFSKFAGLTGFNVYRSDSQYGSFTKIASQVVTRSYEDAAVTPGQTYWYYVTALYSDPDGESAPSNRVSAKTSGGEILYYEFQWDNGVPNTYGKLPRNHIVATKFVPELEFYTYTLEGVRFHYYDYQLVKTGQTSVKVHVNRAGADGKVGAELGSTGAIILNQNQFYPNWAEIQLGSLGIVTHRNEGLFIGIEYVDKDSSSVLFDETQNIPHNIVFYRYQNAWYEHYDFWTSPEAIGFPILRAIFSVLSDVETYPTSKQKPADFELLQNYPNPFNPETEIRFALPVESQVRLSVFNQLGQEIIKLIDGKRPAGFHSVQWKGQNEYNQIVPSGIYFYTLKTDGYVESRKMILLR
ncbi:S8 family peptidase [candidate division KSB1 bacterium]|nr:S8 family peptidase [candidate division KSB1 bacterium]